ncbi:hypothetical protein CYJ36_00450 [Bacillus sp. UMB0893]|nr:hypothetical protein CYJ36_00450 [Bacillus sp. UMB0893]
MPVGSPIPLYFPQESSAFRYNPLKVLTITLIATNFTRRAFQFNEHDQAQLINFNAFHNTKKSGIIFISLKRALNIGKKPFLILRSVF